MRQGYRNEKRADREREREEEGKVREAGNGEKEEELNKLLRIRLPRCF